MIRVHIDLPDLRDRSGVGSELPAAAEPEGYRVVARCSGWGRNRDGSLRVDVVATITSPPGLVEAWR